MRTSFLSSHAEYFKSLKMYLGVDVSTAGSVISILLLFRFDMVLESSSNLRALPNLIWFERIQFTLAHSSDDKVVQRKKQVSNQDIVNIFASSQLLQIVPAGPVPDLALVRFTNLFKTSSVVCVIPNKGNIVRRTTGCSPSGISHPIAAVTK